MIEELRRLRDLLDGIQTDFNEIDVDDLGDPACIYEAQDIVDALLHKHEKPDPIAPVGNCYRVPTPPPPPPPPVAAAAPRRPENQQPKFGGRQKPKVSRSRKTKPQDEAA
jgi:type IV secretory pathway VirB10-like protein